jgi:acyl-CoA thioester hydrolase
MAYADLKKRLRSDYGFHLDYRTRWYPKTARVLAFIAMSMTSRYRSDNDMYDHLNNSIYSFLYARLGSYGRVLHMLKSPP